ncbi:MAG TPA: DUF4352 domain-containing protein [Pyrinomonadaceae bacterium]|jgi:hypothetical protein|nr:DUF4352 domain-containing protein [Pyrinomonadaceae bacterium]
MGAILLLMTIGGSVIAAILMVISFLKGISWLRTFVLGGVAVWYSFYIIIFLTSSVFSEEKTLALNEPKSFCGFYFDCHLHTAVTNVRRAKTLGDKTASGEFYIVKVKVFSDAKREPLRLIGTEAKIIDAQKREYERDTEAEKFLGEQPAFEKQIAPTETFTKEIVFDIPADAKDPRLDLKDGYGIDHYIEAVLVGDEDSFFHKRTYFGLAEQTQTVSAK